ncbi:MAG: gephyrin-like molybdotransferase Glp [Myxococcota bacterium]
MISIHDALERMLPCFEPRGAVRVPLDRALGRFAAEEVVARESSPPFDNSAMDGYAVRARDVAAATEDAPVRLPVIGESRAGGPPPPPLAEGTAQRIFTGAPLPPGADAVVMQESTERNGNQVGIRAPAASGAHVRHAGEDLRAGEVMLPRGSAVGPGEVGLLASQRYAHLSIHRPPRVAILSTGDELRDIADPPEPGTIVDSNAHALAAQVREAGGEPVVLPRAPDAPQAIATQVREGLQTDVLLSCGGVSVGAHDHVHEAFEASGVRMGFWKVAIKPGKPLTFGRAGAVPVVGLPGNPVSAMVTFEVLVRPGLRRMLGDPRPHPTPLRVVLAAGARHKPGRTELLRCRLTPRGGQWSAAPSTRQGSGALPSMVGAEALVVVPSHRGDVEAGEPLWALPLVGRLGGVTSPFAPGGPLDERSPDR